MLTLILLVFAFVLLAVSSFWNPPHQPASLSLAFCLSVILGSEGTFVATHDGFTV
jgi:hypothetical protein